MHRKIFKLNRIAYFEISLDFGDDFMQLFSPSEAEYNKKTHDPVFVGNSIEQVFSSFES